MPANSPTLLVLAAGMGSRYGGLKQIDPVGPNGEAILDYSVFDALRAGFERVVFIIRHDIEAAFRESIGARFASSISVDYVFQELADLPPGFTVPEGRTKPWGTTQAVLAATEAIQGPFAVINADDFYGAQSYRVLAQHLLSGSTEAAMVGFVLRRTLSDFGSVSRGVCRVDADGKLADIVETIAIEPAGDGARSVGANGATTPLTGEEPVSMNMWGFQPTVFSALRERFLAFLAARGGEQKSECYLPAAVNELIHQNNLGVRVLGTGSDWFGVTYREDRPRVAASIQALISSGAYPEKLGL